MAKRKLATRIKAQGALLSATANIGTPQPPEVVRWNFQQQSGETYPTGAQLTPGSSYLIPGALYTVPQGQSATWSLVNQPDDTTIASNTPLVTIGQSVQPSSSYPVRVAIAGPGVGGDSRLFGFVIQAGNSTYLRTLYVNNVTGDDSRTITQAQNASTPWRTIHRAVKGSATAGQTNTGQAATAGDLVLVAATGQPYWEVGIGSGRWNVALNPVNNGTAANPICIRGSGDRPEIRAANAGFRGPMIGAASRNYIIWDSFKIDDTYCASTGDTGPVVFSGLATNGQLLNSEIQGHNGSYYWGHATFGGNYRLIGLEDAFYTTIRNNKISRALFGAANGGANEAGIMAYDTAYSLIEQNTIWNCGSGIFIKGLHFEDIIPTDRMRGNVIRRNVIHGCHSNGLWHNEGVEARIYQNIFRANIGNCHTLRLVGNPNIWADPYNPQPGDSFNHTRDSAVFNNTLYANAQGIVLTNVRSDVDNYGWPNMPLNFRVAGNLLVAQSYSAYHDWAKGTPLYPPSMVMERNLYFNNAQHWRPESGTAVGYAAWQSTYGRDTVGSLNGQDPLFVDAAAANLRLQAGSPALGLARDTYGIAGGDASTPIPAGAYITGSEQIGANW